MEAENSKNSYFETIKGYMSAIPEFLRYVVAGGLTFLSEIFSTLFFVEIIGIEEVRSGLLGWFIALIVSYILNVRIVFTSSKGGKSRFVAFMASTAVVGLILNTILLPIFINDLELHIVIAKTIIIALIMVINFVIRKFFIFKEEKGTLSGEVLDEIK